MSAIALQVDKYSQVFPGLQSLLGPDRKYLPSPEALVLGWGVVQLTGVLTTAAGARFARLLIGWRAQRGLSCIARHG